MLKQLTGSWCLILGASSGMGRATALTMARAGVNVIGVHFDTAEGQEKAAVLAEELRSLGVQAELVNANAANPKARRDLVSTVARLTGIRGVRVFLHSLAFGSLARYIPDVSGLATITATQMDMTLNVMAHSLVYWTQELFAAGMLNAGAKIFAMTSAGDEHVSPNYGAVSAAKCALESHVRQLAVELAPHGVAVNAIRAGVTITPSLERIPEHRYLIDTARSRNPHQRLTTPEDVAEAVVVLSSTSSSWITGNVINVDGGEVLTG